MANFIDDLGRQVQLPSQVNRIVSLVPSLTELLFDFQLDDQIIGITKFCELPKERVAHITKIGGTKTADVTAIKALKPDLIIASKEENVKAQIDELSEHCKVWVSDIANIRDAINSIKTLGSMTNSIELANEMAVTIENDFSNFQSKIDKSVLYMIWRKPFMAVGSDSFINDMLSKLGLSNSIEQTRYPKLNENKIKDLNPQVIMLSSEPYPFKQKHIAELQAILPNARILLVDGQIFSWYGSRMLNAIAYFKQLSSKIAD